MRVIICGGREFSDEKRLSESLDALHGVGPITVLIHGNVTGAGIIAERWARRNGINVVRYPPNWEAFGRRAEGIRNSFMLSDSRPDCLVLFAGGDNTRDLHTRAQAAGIPIVRCDESAPDANAEQGEDPGDRSPSSRRQNCSERRHKDGPAYAEVAIA
ncbi:MAG: DUF2493 domain-containing protein [Salinarimonas sp.]